MRHCIQYSLDTEQMGRITDSDTHILREFGRSSLACQKSIALAPSAGQIIEFLEPMAACNGWCYGNGLVDGSVPPGIYEVRSVYMAVSPKEGWHLMHLERIEDGQEILFSICHHRSVLCDWQGVRKYQPPTEIRLPKPANGFHDRVKRHFDRYQHLEQTELLLSHPAMFWQFIFFKKLCLAGSLSLSGSLSESAILVRDKVVPFRKGSVMGYARLAVLAGL